jgi:hypothetical protein
MITYADSNDEQFLSIVQSMTDLDFLDPSRFERNTSTPENDPWYLR